MPSTRGTNFYLADPNLEFVFGARECGLLGSIVDWESIPADALAADSTVNP